MAIETRTSKPCGTKHLQTPAAQLLSQIATATTTALRLANAAAKATTANAESVAIIPVIVIHT